MRLADGTRPRRPMAIEPTGRVNLGRRLALEQHVRAQPTGTSRFWVGLPEDGLIPPWEDPLSGVQPGELPRQDLELGLRDAGDELFIEGAGLTKSYGIFGAPGSGKTFLMMRLMRQLLALDEDEPERRMGALILDPKASLIDDFRELAATVGRADDLVVLNADELEARNEQVNLIDSDLDPYELARVLVLAARSAGVGASEDFWFGAWQNLFSAAIFLLKWLGENVLTLRELLEAVLIVERPDA